MNEMLNFDVQKNLECEKQRKKKVLIKDRKE